MLKSFHINSFQSSHMGCFCPLKQGQPIFEFKSPHHIVVNRLKISSCLNMIWFHEFCDLIDRQIFLMFSIGEDLIYVLEQIKMEMNFMKNLFN
jgi:hypothetical protein